MTWDKKAAKRMREHSDEVEGFLDLVKDTLEAQAWAEDTLEGIYDSVSRTGRVTEGQRRAVQNIADAGERRWRE